MVGDEDLEDIFSGHLIKSNSMKTTGKMRVASPLPDHEDIASALDDFEEDDDCDIPMLTDEEEMEEAENERSLPISYISIPTTTAVTTATESPLLDKEGDEKEGENGGVVDKMAEREEEEQKENKDGNRRPSPRGKGRQKRKRRAVKGAEEAAEKDEGGRKKQKEGDSALGPALRRSEPRNKLLAIRPTMVYYNKCRRMSMLEISSAGVDDGLITIFRRDMHCTDACVIRVIEKSGVCRQSMLNCTIPMLCVNRTLLEENVASLAPGCFLRITRMQNQESINGFHNSDVFAKRSVIKGGDILRTLAVYETREQFDFQDQETLDKEARKVLYNRFTNIQRLDRGVGSRLKWKYMERYGVEESDTIEALEGKADVSFSIFRHTGFLLYESREYREKHVTMIKAPSGLYYFIPKRMLSAFGSQWAHRYRWNLERSGGSAGEKKVAAAQRHSEMEQELSEMDLAVVPYSVPRAVSIPVAPEERGGEPGVEEEEVITRNTRLHSPIVRGPQNVYPRYCRGYTKPRGPRTKSKGGGVPCESKANRARVAKQLETIAMEEREEEMTGLPLEMSWPLMDGDTEYDIAALPLGGQLEAQVRLITVGKKGEEQSTGGGGEAAGSGKKVTMISTNKVLEKGEILLTTKDHIIFRVPRAKQLASASIMPFGPTPDQPFGRTPAVQVITIAPPATTETTPSVPMVTAETSPSNPMVTAEITPSDSVVVPVRQLTGVPVSLPEATSSKS